MTILKNKRWELFARARAQGMGQNEAYIEAGYKEDPSNAQKLAIHPEVMLRVHELQRAYERDQDRFVTSTAAAEDVTQDWVVARLRANALMALGEIPAPSTVTVKGRGGHPRTQTAWKIERNASAANAALQLIGAHLGMWKADAVKMEGLNDAERSALRKLLAHLDPGGTGSAVPPGLARPAPKSH